MAKVVLRFGFAKQSKNLERCLIVICHILQYVIIHGCIVTGPDSAGWIRHGLDKQKLGTFNNCNSYGRNIVSTTSRIFESFCNKVPKVKYCHEFTKGGFS